MALSTTHFQMKFHGVLKIQQPFLLPVRLLILNIHPDADDKTYPLKVLSKKKCAEKLNFVPAIES